MQSKGHGYALRYMRIGALLLWIVPAFGGQQSAQVTSGTASVTLPNTAPWTTIGLNTNPMRWELRLHNFGSAWPGYPSYLVNLGPLRLMNNAGNVVAASSVLDNYFGSVYNNGPSVGPCCSGLTDVLVRVQRDVVNAQYTIEVCSVAGGGCLTGDCGDHHFGPPSWAEPPWRYTRAAVLAFLRWFSSVVPVGTPIPTGGVLGDLGDWEFEGNMLDSSGHGHKFSGGSVSLFGDAYLSARV